jgi:hypothetical protein
VEGEKWKREEGEGGKRKVVEGGRGKERKEETYAFCPSGGVTKFTRTSAQPRGVKTSTTAITHLNRGQPKNWKLPKMVL